MISIYTYSNEEQGWTGGRECDIQVHFKNFYNTQGKGYNVCIPCPSSVLNYNTFRDKISYDFEYEYNMFKRYGQPRVFKELYTNSK